MARARLAFQLGYGASTVLVWAASFYPAGLFDERRVHEVDGYNNWHQLLPAGACDSAVGGSSL
ncbi:MAG: hypothetical protein RXO54_06640 [Acidilobus sp.]